MDPWNDWYLVTGNTYGSWLPGDDRGWKTRHGREQPGASPRMPMSAKARGHLYDHSRRIMTRAPVVLSVEARRVACTAIVSALQFHQIEVLVTSVDDHHFHTLARFPEHNPRRICGIAKTESARALSKAGLAEPGGVWAIRSSCKPIRDRAHQLEVVRYIAGHAERGATVWCAWKHARPCPTSSRVRRNSGDTSGR